MASYIIRRLLAMIPALLGIALITFVLMHIPPGGPFTSEHTNQAIQAALNHAYHLDQPQWPTFLGPNAATAQLLVAVTVVLAFAGALLMQLLRVKAYGIIRPVLLVV